MMYKKIVYCIDNVSTECSVDDIRSFVTGLGVRVLTCFEVSSRRRRSDNDNDVRSRKVFRLCIPENDQALLLDATKWPDSVFIAEWYFKPKISRADGGTRSDVGVRPGGTSQTTTDTSTAAQASQSSRSSPRAISHVAAEPLCCSASDNAMEGDISDTMLLYHDGAAIASC